MKSVSAVAMMLLQTISVRGAQLVRNKFGLSSQLFNANDYTHDWMVRLCALVNRRLARELKLAITDGQIMLVETAELAGYKSRNLVGSLADRLQTLLEKGRGVTKIRATNEIELFKRQQRPQPVDYYP
jgi:hypothetical protein